MARIKTPKGVVLYHGPSKLDGAPIVAIMTGIKNPSSNPKTGPMAQVWIMRADMDPQEALRHGEDSSVCGSCIHRGQVTDETRGKRFPINRGCYVRMTGPLTVWRAWQRGNYLDISQDLSQWRPEWVRKLGVRLGSYGDPAALPFEVLQTAITGARHHTGYTHQIAHPKFDTQVLSLCMVSADTAEAVGKGVRTFRVLAPNESLQAGEIFCPATPEGGDKSSCDRCGLCSGTKQAQDKRASIAVYVHGTSASLSGFAKTRASLAVLN